ncbi:MAG TPA: hypothetical protein VFH08_17085 [Chitinophagaceae bacterium]|nr:hypothetical protein [Chitinophagaceae bacterium]
MLTGKDIACFCTVFFLALIPYCVCSQKIDSAKNALPQKRSFLEFLLRSITRSGVDSMQPGVLIRKNEASFLPYAGKGIRHILIKEFGFEKTFIDTTKEISYFGKDFVRRLHRNTKEWVIRNNLFIKEKTALNANLVADNERYLRSLDYIHDARILVATIANEPDSIDLIVITKDFLSITLQLNDATASRLKTKIGDANLVGTAQNIQVTTLLEKKRNPHFGYEIRYRLNTIASTFINTTIGYSKISRDLYDGALDEQSWYAGIERPPVSQYLHIAGALQLAHHQSHNNYLKPDSLFYNYHYNTFDAWIGYNLGVRKFLLLKTVLNRQFISIRYFRNKFQTVPYQLKDGFNFRFNDREAILAQFTFFKQDFYKTNYVLGFGITEDVPYGYNIALTAGWYKQLHMERPYAGVDANLYTVTNKGNVMQYFFRTGGFLNKNRIQDAAVLIGTSSFSRIYSYKNLKLRHYLRFSYTRQFNRIGTDPLFIKNIFGLKYIALDSATGNQRFSLHTETIFFIKLKVLGFKFAPFASADIAHFTPENENTSNSGFYPGFGGGIRTRNENILFGTSELRFMYFPRKSEQHNAFKFTFSTNLRFRYNNNYVKAPDIIQVNTDFDNNIF